MWSRRSRARCSRSTRGRRRARDGQRGPVRRGLARPDQARPTRPRSTRCWTPRRTGRTSPSTEHGGYLSLTDADREAMLEAIGVASVDELFAQIPAGVRFERALDVPPALSGAGARAASRGARRAQRPHGARALVPRRRGSTTTTSPRSSTRALPGRVPDGVHAVPAGDEPGRAAGDLRVPDRDLRAHRRWTCRTRRATTAPRSPPTRASSPSITRAARRSCSPRRSTRRCARW